MLWKNYFDANKAITAIYLPLWQNVQSAFCRLHRKGKYGRSAEYNRRVKQWQKKPH